MNSSGVFGLRLRKWRGDGEDEKGEESEEEVNCWWGYCWECEGRESGEVKI